MDWRVVVLKKVNNLLKCLPTPKPHSESAMRPLPPLLSPGAALCGCCDCVVDADRADHRGVARAVVQLPRSDIGSRYTLIRCRERFILFARELSTKHSFKRFQHFAILTEIQDEKLVLLIEMRRADPANLAGSHRAAIG